MPSTGCLENSPFVAQYVHSDDADDDGSEEERCEESEMDRGCFVDQAPRQVGKPMPQTYQVPVAGGGSEQRLLKFTIDFTSAASVATANKSRRLAVWRQRTDLGLAILRRKTGSTRSGTTI